MIPAKTLSGPPRAILAVLAADLARVAVYNTAIAAFLTIATDYGFRHNFIYSQAIGLCIALGLTASCLLRGKDRPALIDVAVGLPFGFAAGFGIGTWANGMTLAQLLHDYPQAVLMSASAALLFGLIASYYFYNQLRLEEMQAEARAERLRRSEQEALLARAELRLLQARIEPHFLFNTLAVVVELLDSRPAAARTMLLNLVSLLRGALANTHRETVPLDEELRLLGAYLEIMAERMGPRLAYLIEADEAARHAALPPLLVQPLVENAIRHGLEPKLDGGRLRIGARREGNRLVVEVADSGAGIADAAKGCGVGLANIRERLANRYGAEGRLDLAANADGGITARLEIPYSCAS